MHLVGVAKKLHFHESEAKRCQKVMGAARRDVELGGMLSQALLWGGSGRWDRLPPGSFAISIHLMMVAETPGGSNCTIACANSPGIKGKT